MSKVVDEVVAANQGYVREFGKKGELAMPPARHFAILTCMDARLDPAKYDVLSPREGPRRSTLVFVSHKERERNRSIYERLREAGVFAALRAGKLRLAPPISLYPARRQRTDGAGWECSSRGTFAAWPLDAQSSSISRWK